MSDDDCSERKIVVANDTKSATTLARKEGFEPSRARIKSDFFVLVSIFVSKIRGELASVPLKI